MKRANPHSLAATRRRRSSRVAEQWPDRWFHPQVELLEDRCLLSMAPSTIEGRWAFYDHSKYDGNVAGINAGDSDARADDKSALTSGLGAATFANVTSFSKGINGLFVDISGSHPNVTTSDFTFRVGNNNSPSSWLPAADPVAVTVLASGGTNGADRVEILWTDGLISGKWLRVTVAANVNTGLDKSDVFYFGNAIGNTGAGDTVINSTVNAIDEGGARNHPAVIGDNIPSTNLYDFNRDGRVNAIDEGISRNNATNSQTVVKYVSPPAISPPVLTADLAVDSGPDGVPNNDGITINQIIGGNLTGANTIVSFKAGLNSGPVTTDALGLVQVGGDFTLSAAFLDGMNGSPLADGNYVVHLQAVDSEGLSAAVHVAFTLKRSIATPSLPDLITLDDTGSNSTDNLTRLSAPRIDVTAESGSLVRLLVDNVQVNQGTASPTIQFTLPAQSDGSHQIKAVAIDGAGNSATSSVLTITIDTVAPSVTVSTMVPFTDDKTPHVTITSTAGSTANLDVDINNDGDFADSGELARTVTTLLNTKSTFQLTPALPADLSGVAYVVQLRARVTDSAGNEGTSPLQSLQIDTIGSSALADYVNAVDPTYGYTVAYDSGTTFTGYKFYALDMNSQTWRSSADVDKPLWRHWVELVVPDGAISTTAMLFITSGNNQTTPGGTFATIPSSPDTNMRDIALATHSVTVRLRTVPSEPLMFTDETISRSEDQIIAYTFDKYMNHLGDPGNETWPLLVAMVKSAKAAMDAAVNHVEKPAVKGTHINDFLVTGASKRGWTTWLTAAVDSRVKAIIPQVIDVLNMDEQMMHHHAYYTGNTVHTIDGFSDPIGDYVAFNIPEEVLTAEQRELGRIVDPYSYLNNGRFDNMPKLLVNGSGDEYFVSDSSEYYFSDLPGTQNYLRYVPSAGHNLSPAPGTNTPSAVTSTKTFYDAVLNNRPLPQYTWSVLADGSILLHTTTAPATNGVKMWQALNSSARDFRFGYTGITWTDSVLTDMGGGNYLATASTPATGARAFFIEMTYDRSFDTTVFPGLPFVFTTQIIVKSNIALSDWPFYMPPNPGSAPGSASGSGDDGSAGAVASGLAMTAVAGGSTQQSPVAAPTAVVASSQADEDDESADDVTTQWLWADGAVDDLMSDDAQLVELALGLGDGADFI